MPTLTPVVLTTERLRLRWMDARDTDAQFALFADPDVTRYWSGAAWTERAQAEAFIAGTVADYASGAGVRFAIELVESDGTSGAMIGNANLHHFVDASRRCEIGYALASSHWSRGYASEALRAVIDYGFSTLDLNRIEADIDPANIASGRVLEKLGFRKEGYMPERWIVNGQAADTVNYGLLKRYRDAHE